MTTTDTAILKFQDDNGDHTFLSNFYPSPLEYDGLTYPTVENFFQAMKCDREMNGEMRQKFTDNSPGQAKRLGRGVRLRPDWESIKLDVMTHGIALKFASGSELAQQLCDTGDAWLEEGNTWGDYFWGTVNGAGRNWLGLILMRRRREILTAVAK